MQPNKDNVESGIVGGFELGGFELGGFELEGFELEGSVESRVS